MSPFRAVRIPRQGYHHRLARKLHVALEVVADEQQRLDPTGDTVAPSIRRRNWVDVFRPDREDHVVAL